MPPIPSLALVIKALISFVVLGISITAINAVGFSNDVYTKGSTGTLFTPPVSPPAVEFGQGSDCPACLFDNLDNVRLAPTPTLPLKISWAAPSMVRPKLSPTSVAPPPGTTSTAATLVSNPSKVEDFTIWCKNLSPSIFRRDAAWIVVGGMFLAIFVTATTYLLLHRLPSLKSYLTKAKDIGRGILFQGQLASKAKQSLETLMVILRGRFADPTILALAIYRHMELSYDAELERRSKWKAATKQELSNETSEWKAATKQRLSNEANARLNEIFREWQVAEEKRTSDLQAAEEKRMSDWQAAEEKRMSDWQAAEEKRMSDWQAAEKKRILDKSNAHIKEHSREHVQQEKMKTFRKVTGIIDKHPQDRTKMKSELHELWDAEFGQVGTSDTISQGEAQQPKPDQRLPNMKSTPRQKKEEGEAQQPEAAHADSKQLADLDEKYERVAAQKPELATEPAEVAPEVKEDRAEAHQSQEISELGADMSHPKENGDEGEARGSEHADGPAVQTENLEDNEQKAEVQQSESAHVSQNLAVELEEGRDDGQSQRPEDADGGSKNPAQIDAEEETRVPRTQNMGPKDEGNEANPVIEDVREQDDNESATRRALNEELQESVVELYRSVLKTNDNGSTSVVASQVRRSAQNAAEFCIKWYDVQIGRLNNANGDPEDPSPDPNSDVSPPSCATTTEEDRDAWYTRRLLETHLHIGRLKKIIDYEEKRQTMKAKFISFGWDLRTSPSSISDTESRNDETGHEETQDRPFTPEGSYPATETEVQPQGMSKTRKRNLERKRAKAKKVEKVLESQQ